VHDPSEHAYGQALAAPQLPLALHVWTPLPEHCAEPGVHVPVHAPLTHACAVHGTGVPQVPLAPHACTPLPEHCFWPDVHEPPH
jgi:hypothetical protein